MGANSVSTWMWKTEHKGKLGDTAVTRNNDDAQMDFMF